MKDINFYIGVFGVFILFIIYFFPIYAAILFLSMYILGAILSAKFEKSTTIKYIIFCISLIITVTIYYFWDMELEIIVLLARGYAEYYHDFDPGGFGGVIIIFIYVLLLLSIPISILFVIFKIIKGIIKSL